MANELATIEEQLEEKLIKELQKPDVDVEAINALKSIGDMIEKQAKSNWVRAMAKSQHDFPVIKKDKHVDVKGKRFDFASLESIYTSCKPIWTENGFSVSMTEEAHPTVQDASTFIMSVSHAGGHTEVFTWSPVLDNKGIAGTVNKTDIQALGSSTTYAQRYLLRMAFNLVTGEDIDNDGFGVGKSPNQNLSPSTEITKDMLNVIEGMVTKTNTDPLKVCQAMGVQTLSELSRKQAMEVLDILKKKQARAA